MKLVFIAFSVLFLFCNNAYTQQEISRDSLVKITNIGDYNKREKRIEKWEEKDSIFHEKYLSVALKKTLLSDLERDSLDWALRSYNLLGDIWFNPQQMDSLVYYGGILDKHLLNYTFENAITGEFYYKYSRPLEYVSQDSLQLVKQLQSDAIFSKLQDSTGTSWAHLSLELGIYYRAKGDFLKAMKYYNAAQSMYKKQGDEKHQLYAYGELAALYGVNGLYKEATLLRKPIFDYFEKEKDYESLTTEYLNQAEMLKIKGELKQALKVIDTALVKAEKSNRGVYKFFAYNYKATYSALDNNEEVFRAYDAKLIPLYKSFKGHPYFDALYNNAASYRALFNGDLNNSIAITKQNINNARNSNNNDLVLENTLLLYDLYKKQGDYKNANEALNSYTTLKDSTNRNILNNQILFYQTEFEQERRDDEIKEQKSNIALLDEQNKRKQQYLIFGTAGLLALFGGILLYRSRQNALRRKKLQEQHAQNLVAFQETERTQLARDLHDSVGQKLMLLSKETNKTENTLVQSLSAESLQEIRAIARGLYPAMLDNYGFTAATEDMVNTIDAATETFVLFEAVNVDKYLTKERALHTYRIIQEALTNMVKHANATEATVAITKNNQKITVQIQDNGKGFDTKKAFLSLGMQTLKDRAQIIKSDISIESSKGKGTVIKLLIPIANV